MKFITGIIQSNNAIKMLFGDINKHYNFKYILTYRLNQDVLQKFFGMIRTKGGLHDHPDQQEFKYRLRTYLLGYNDGLLSSNANISADDTEDLVVFDPSLTGNS